MTAADAIARARSSGFKLAVDGDRLEYEAPSPASLAVLEMLRRHKTDVIELLHDERRAVVRYLSDNFKSSPLGRCVCCGGVRRGNEQFVSLFCGSDSADIHAVCHAPWIARQEATARRALGIDERTTPFIPGAQTHVRRDPS